ncbi:hypothetical protein [Planktothricoides raciborskii]|uniref:Uncharacterized protein n=1 Tax=Planktothricoides raciborskii GIHE-MW2 TaxID=2792601 RepID=A0AAU8J6T7_9CYAN
MNYSHQALRSQIETLREVREIFAREIARIDRLLQEWECATVENDEGEISFLADLLDS